MIVKGENVPHFQKMSGDKMRAPTSPSNVFQILNQLQKQQQAVDQSKNTVQSISSRTTTPSERASIPITTAMVNPENNSSITTQAFPINATACSGPPATYWCTCPQAIKAGTEAQRLGCSAESQDTHQW